MKHLLLGIFFLIVISGCTKKETVELELKSDFIGEVFTFSEVGAPLRDYANVQVQVEGLPQSLNLVTDTAGKFYIDQLPMGTYKFILTKEGFGIGTVSNVKIIGGDKPVHYRFALFQKSRTTVTDYTLSIENDMLIVKGSIQHYYQSDGAYAYIRPFLEITVSNAPDFTGYVFKDYFYVLESDYSRFETKYFIQKQYFPTGSSIYVKLCGRNAIYGNYVYDFESDTYYDNTTGAPSQVKSIIVP